MPPGCHFLAPATHSTDNIWSYTYVNGSRYRKILRLKYSVLTVQVLRPALMWPNLAQGTTRGLLFLTPGPRAKRLNISFSVSKRVRQATVPTAISILTIRFHWQTGYGSIFFISKPCLRCQMDVTGHASQMSKVIYLHSLYISLRRTNLLFHEPACINTHLVTTFKKGYINTCIVNFCITKSQDLRKENRYEFKPTSLHHLQNTYIGFPVLNVKQFYITIHQNNPVKVLNLNWI